MLSSNANAGFSKRNNLNLDKACDSFKMLRPLLQTIIARYQPQAARHGGCSLMEAVRNKISHMAIISPVGESAQSRIDEPRPIINVKIAGATAGAT
jgi:hypothetical protein